MVQQKSDKMSIISDSDCARLSRRQFFGGFLDKVANLANQVRSQKPKSFPAKSSQIGQNLTMQSHSKLWLQKYTLEWRNQD